MSHTSRTSRRASILAAGATLGLLALVATACGPAADHTGPEGVEPAPVVVEAELVNDAPANWPRLLNGVCEFDPRSLPRTPDAVEGWYRSCRARVNAMCEFDPRSLPRTPDAVEGWNRSCRARY